MNNRLHVVPRAALAVALLFGLGSAQALAIELDAARYDPACGVEIAQHGEQIHVAWPLDAKRRAQMIFDLADGAPLVRSIAIATSAEAAPRPIAAGLDPALRLRVGKRDLLPGHNWTVFFDRMQYKPHDTHVAESHLAQATAASHARRATLTLGDVAAGPFRGQWRWTFFAGEPLVLQEALLQTQQDAVAYLYDAGLSFREQPPARLAWRNALGEPRTQPAAAIARPRHLAVHLRSIAAALDGGSLALFPPPHRYFYPLDFSTNLENVWAGPGYAAPESPFGFGIRHDPRGDNRFVPWFNAPPGTVQEMGLFLLLCDAAPEEALATVARLTRDDHFVPLPGHRVFTSHYHVEHTARLLEAQQSPPQPDDLAGRLPTGGAYRLPAELESPGFARVLRGLGAEIVHLAEFHFGHTPNLPTDERLKQLELLHAECARLSDDRFLLLPGEEPNVHLGGHWISLFPHPVYWVLNRPASTPFVAEHPTLGRVYHVGDEADVYRLLQAETGLAWTAHPRIKSSAGFPDKYRDRPFFTSERFLGGAWKAMPADLSRPRLGERVLDLLDDMSHWGAGKYALGEVDVFHIEPDHELYAHMNVNYLRLEAIPRFADGWQSVLDALRAGAFFVTTGEVLVPEFTVDGRRSGERLQVSGGESQIRVDLQWTFPLSCAEIVSGDGRQTRRTRIDLAHTAAFGAESFTWPVDLRGQRFVRVEVWDVATNGAFTQPVWLDGAP